MVTIFLFCCLFLEGDKRRRGEREDTSDLDHEEFEVMLTAKNKNS